MSDGRNELHDLLESLVKDSPHGIHGVEEEQGDVQGHDQIRDDTKRGRMMSQMIVQMMRIM